MATKKKSSKTFGKIREGLEDAIAYSKGDKTRAKVVSPKKSYRVFAECELKATTPEEAKKQFMKLLKEFEDAIDVQENEITETNIDDAAWIGSRPDI